MSQCQCGPPAPSEISLHRLTMHHPLKCGNLHLKCLPNAPPQYSDSVTLAVCSMTPQDCSLPNTVLRHACVQSDRTCNDVVQRLAPLRSSTPSVALTVSYLTKINRGADCSQLYPGQLVSTTKYHKLVRLCHTSPCLPQFSVPPQAKGWTQAQAVPVSTQDSLQITMWSTLGPLFTLSVTHLATAHSAKDTCKIPIIDECSGPCLGS